MSEDEQEPPVAHPTRSAQERAALRHLLYIIAEHPDVRKALDQARPATGVILQALASDEATEYETVTALHRLVEQEGPTCDKCGCPIEVFKTLITDAWDSTCTNSQCPGSPEEYGIQWIDWDETRRIMRQEEANDDREATYWDHH
jgi:hypothetical protein